MIFPCSICSIYIIILFQEFEQLIDQHGAEQVTQLMQKVISALEHLEILDISHNRVQTLSEAILADNSFLRILDCRHNQLAAIDEMVFRKNNLLEEINLSHNKVGKTFSSKYLLLTSQIFFPS